MANLYISEYKTISYEVAGMTPMVQIAREGDDIVRRDPIDFSGGEAQSSDFAATTKFVEIWSDEDCLYAVGADPDASVAGTPLTAKASKVFGIVPGDKISVVGMA